MAADRIIILVSNFSSYLKAGGGGGGLDAILG